MLQNYYFGCHFNWIEYIFINDISLNSIKSNDTKQCLLLSLIGLINELIKDNPLEIKRSAVLGDIRQDS